MGWIILGTLVLGVAGAIARRWLLSRHACAVRAPQLESALHRAGLRVVAAQQVGAMRTPFPRVCLEVGAPTLKVMGTGLGDAYPIHMEFVVANAAGVEQTIYARVRMDDLGNESVDWIPPLNEVARAMGPVPIPRTPGFRIEPPPGKRW